MIARVLRFLAAALRRGPRPAVPEQDPNVSPAQIAMRMAPELGLTDRPGT